MTSRRYLPRPAVRAYLHAWPAGEVRPVRRVLDDIYFDIPALLAAGYINRKGVAQGSNAWVRTLKPMRPYVPRGPRANYNYTGVFPWSIAEHWARIQGSPHRVTTEVSQKLEGQKKVYYWQRDTSDQVAVPVAVSTKTEVVELRRLLPPLFGVRTGTKRAKYLAQNSSWTLPKLLTPLLVTGAGLRRVLLELLVEPAFNADGTLQRFVAVDPDAALAELQQLWGGGTTIAERYRTFMEVRV